MLALAPCWGDRQTLRLIGRDLHLLALASLWNLLAGYAGLVSVGQQAYVGLRRLCVVRAGDARRLCIRSPPFRSPAIAALVAIPVATLVFRLQGAYFAIGTWVVAEVFRLLSSQISVLGGGSGISLPAAVIIAMAPSRQSASQDLLAGAGA